jgi:hypothetical protein
MLKLVKKLLVKTRFLHLLIFPLEAFSNIRCYHQVVITRLATAPSVKE